MNEDSNTVTENRRVSLNRIQINQMVINKEIIRPDNEEMRIRNDNLSNVISRDEIHVTVDLRREYNTGILNKPS